MKYGLAPLDERIKGFLRYGDAMSVDFMSAGGPDSREEVQAEVERMVARGELERDYKWRSVVEWRLAK